MARLRTRVSYGNVVATLALVIALGGTSWAAITLPKNSVGRKQLKKNAVVSKKVKDGSLKAKDFGDDLLAGLQGPQGPQGPRGPSFGDSELVGNVNDIPCNADTVVGSMPVTVPEPSRIWVYGQGAYRADDSGQEEFGLYLRLRDAGNTATLATSAESWDASTDAADADLVQALSTGGALFEGANPDLSAAAHVAQPGTYVLQLVVTSTAGPVCATDFPDFGYNQGGVMGYVLLGTG